MRPNRLLTLGGYLVTLYLVTVPLAETLIAVWPLQLGDASWRHGAVGLFSQAVMTPVLGLLLAVCLALYVQHRVVLRALAVVSGLGALLTIAVIALFLLDAIEMRARLVDAATGAFDVATVFALLKMGATVLAGVAMALGAMSAARAMKEVTRRRTAAPLVAFPARGRREEALPERRAKLWSRDVKPSNILIERSADHLLRSRPSGRRERRAAHRKRGRMAKVVVHRASGRLEKGNTVDFRPDKETFHLNLESGEVSTVSIDEDVKAVFFVKDLAGNPGYGRAYEDAVPDGCQKVEVRFNDGEVVVGFTTGYSPQRRGWFLIPADASSNNLRIYAVSSAVENVRMLN